MPKFPILQRLENVAAWRRLTPRTRRRVAWTAALLLGYAVFGFLLLPPLVRWVAVKQLSSLLDRKVAIEQVRLNPFVLSGTVRGLVVEDKDGERFLACREAYGNFQLMSFLGRAWVFKEVRVIDPSVRAQLNRDGSLNFSDLLKKFAERARKSTEPTRPPALRVGTLRIAGARASYADLTPATPFRRVIGPVQVTLTQFHTDPDNKNPYSFEGTTDTGERFAWSGHFFLDPLRSAGELVVENVDLAHFGPLYQDFTRFEVRQGSIDLSAAYAVAWSPTNQTARVTNASLRLRSLQVAGQGAAAPFLEVDRLAVAGVSADALARTAAVDAMRVGGGRLLVRRETNAALNLAEMAKPDGTNVSGSVLLMLQSVTNLFADLLRSTNAGRAVVREFHAHDCRLDFEDDANPRPVRLTLDDITLAATNLSNLPGSNLTAVASLRWNTNGAVRAGVTASLAPLAADVNAALERVELAPLGPYLDSVVSVFLTGSRLGMEGHIRLRTTNELGPEASFAGSMRLEDFAAVDGDTGEDLLKFRAASYNGIEARLNPPEFNVAEIALEDLAAHVVLETNQSLNLVRVARLADTNAPAAAAGGDAGAPPTKLGLADLRRQFGRLLQGFSATNLAAARVPVKAAVGRLALSNAAVRLTDRSVAPPVRASLSQIHGQVTGLSSDFRAEVAGAWRARANGAGPVEISLALPPAAAAATNRLTVSFKDVDLIPAGPYSGKYLGYGLRRGKLHLDLRYEMAGRRVKAENVVRLDQFTLGDKVESTNATRLPVKLAVAILKDRNGRIELDVPVEGSLDDPKFRLGRVITSTLVNLITKLVASPFAALGKFFGGRGEDVRFQEFNPGSDELLAASREKLDAVISGLYERPGLELKLEGSVDPAADGDALRRRKLEDELRAKKWAGLRRSEQERQAAAQMTFTPEEYARFLQQTHAVRVAPQAEARAAATEEQPASKAATTARTAPAPRGVKGGEALLRAVPAPVSGDEQSALERELFRTMPVAEEEFRALADARAGRVRQYLLDSGRVEAERLFLKEPAAGGVTTNGSRVWLHLE